MWRYVAEIPQALTIEKLQAQLKATEKELLAACQTIAQLTLEVQSLRFQSRNGVEVEILRDRKKGA